MSNSEADGQKSASDVIGESNSLAEGSGKPLSSNTGPSQQTGAPSGKIAMQECLYDVVISLSYICIISILFFLN